MLLHQKVVVEVSKREYKTKSFRSQGYYKQLHIYLVEAVPYSKLSGKPRTR